MAQNDYRTIDEEHPVYLIHPGTGSALDLVFKQEPSKEEEIEIIKLFDVVPNPFTNIAKMNYIIPKGKKLEVEIWSLAGELMQSSTIEGSASYSINGNAYPMGIYFIKAYSQDGHFHSTQKVIIH